jgi:ABC-type phosphate/phosphonate transport system substrate-binding protein
MNRRQCHGRLGLMGWTALSALAFAGGPAAAQSTPHSAGPGTPPAGREPLSIVLAPFLSPGSLLNAYRPLREHLEKHLQRPVQLLSAKDFRTLAEEARRGEHAVVQLPAHLARLALLDWGCELLAAPAAPVTVLVLVKDTGPVRSPADLRGRSVGTLDPLSLTATVGRRWLDTQGLGTQVQLLSMASVNSAMYALDRDEVAAVVAADTQLATLPAATPRGERVLASIGDVPGPLLLARPRLPRAERDALRAALARYGPDATRPVTAANSRQGPLAEEKLRALDAYAAIARQALGPVAR